MKKTKVLVIDDEEEFASILAERLELRDFEAQVANSGHDGLSAAITEKPDVVVLDLKMPDMSGIDVLERLKRADPGIEVIMLTGHGSTASGIDGMRLGAFDYIMKPVDIAELIVKINQAYEKRQQATTVSFDK
ncbi:MAG: response regulator [Desulfobacteraceae bacterium]|nr:MAG: response regulator [Desulfobacteraceae bacterium]